MTNAPVNLASAPRRLRQPRRRFADAATVVASPLSSSQTGGGCRAPSGRAAASGGRPSPSRISATGRGRALTVLRPDATVGVFGQPRPWRKEVIANRAGPTKAEKDQEEGPTLGA